MSGTYPPLVNPPAQVAQVAVTSTPATLAALLSQSAYPNRSGIQIKSVSANSTSVWWGLEAGITSSNASDEIPPGTAQVVPPNLASDTSKIWLVSDSDTTACIVFISG